MHICVVVFDFGAIFGSFCIQAWGTWLRLKMGRAGSGSKESCSCSVSGFWAGMSYRSTRCKHPAVSSGHSVKTRLSKHTFGPGQVSLRCQGCSGVRLTLVVAVSGKMGKWVFCSADPKKALYKKWGVERMGQT